MTTVFVVTTKQDEDFNVVGVFLTMESAQDFCTTLPDHELERITIWPQEVK